MRNDLLVWIDLEMTGLDPKINTIIEIAAIITDDNLNQIASYGPIAIKTSQKNLDLMDDWNKTQHSKSGLLDLIKISDKNLQQVEEEILNFIKNFVEAKTAPLCGNSIWQDRLFLKLQMPKLDEYLHYRIIDVSTIKELFNRWHAKNQNNKFTKADTHRALQDIEESIKELKYYKDNFFI